MKPGRGTSDVHQSSRITIDGIEHACTPSRLESDSELIPQRYGESSRLARRRRIVRDRFLVRAPAHFSTLRSG
jgi:hypothetical protein